MESISAQLLSTGFFSRLELESLPSPGYDLAATAGLSVKGHDCIARDGFEAFRSRMRSVAAGSGIDWHFTTARSSWPASLLNTAERMPPILSHIEETGGHRLLLQINADLFWFKGHFPGRPILAGVVQLHWASLLIRELYSFDTYPEGIARLKFQHVLIPPAILELKLMSDTRGVVEFSFCSAAHPHSRGRLKFPEPES